MEKNLLNERQKLKEWLKRGDLKAIAVACEVDRDTVYRWFSGAENAAIELVVNRTVEMRRKQAEEAAEKITKH